MQLMQRNQKCVKCWMTVRLMDGRRRREEANKEFSNCDVFTNQQMASLLAFLSSSLKYFLFAPHGRCAALLFSLLQPQHLAKKLDDNVSRQLSFFHTRFLLKPEIHTNDTKVAVQNGKHVKIFSQSLSF